MYGQLLEGPIIKSSPNAPVAQLTKFGWVISGPAENSVGGDAATINHCS